LYSPPRKEKIKKKEKGLAFSMSYQKYALNIYEAAVNFVAADVVLALRMKRLPNLDHALKFGFEKALINVLGSFIGGYLGPMSMGINELDLEYLSSALAAAISSTWKRESASYLAMEQLLISLVSHIIATKSASHAAPYLANMGNGGIETVNPQASLY
jgi:hypothetical protein